MITQRELSTIVTFPLNVKKKRKIQTKQELSVLFRRHLHFALYLKFVFIYLQKFLSFAIKTNLTFFYFLSRSFLVSL